LLQLLNGVYVLTFSGLKFLVLVFLLIAACPSYAANGADNWRSKFPDMKFVGGGVLTVLFMDIYKLNLYANEGRYSGHNDFVLEFEYLKPVSKSTIIDASIDELTKPDDVTSTEIKFWKRILDKGIVDMNAGELASVSFTSEGVVTFYLDDRPPVSFKAPKFAKGFSSIWLGKNTSRPRLRQKLLGK
jgi:hypothetical protein